MYLLTLASIFVLAKNIDWSSMRDC